jgi:hypothetical protein
MSASSARPPTRRLCDAARPSAVGYIVLDELAATTNIQQTVDTYGDGVYAGQNSNATAGVADVIISTSTTTTARPWQN